MTRSFDGVPIAVWSAKNLESEWEGNTSNLVDNQLESRGPSRLEGSLRHHFPEPIEDWVVAYGHQVFRPAHRSKNGTPAAAVARRSLVAADRARNASWPAI